MLGNTDSIVQGAKNSANREAVPGSDSSGVWKGYNALFDEQILQCSIHAETMFIEAETSQIVRGRASRASQSNVASGSERMHASKSVNNITSKQ